MTFEIVQWSLYKNTNFLQKNKNDEIILAFSRYLLIYDFLLSAYLLTALETTTGLLSSRNITHARSFVLLMLLDLYK